MSTVFMGVSNREGNGITLKDVPADLFIKAYAKQLKTAGVLKVPEWAEYVKTGVGKKLSPYDEDWFYIRAAAIARKIYLRPAGVGALRKVFGCKKDGNSRPGKASLASGSILRSCVKQLEGMKILEKDRNGGRHITSAGRKELDRVAIMVYAEFKKNPVVA